MKAIFISAIYVRKVSRKKDPDAHMEEMHDDTTKENYQNFCICTDKCDKCPNKDGYLYQGIKYVGKEKEKHKGLVTINCISPFLDLGRVPSGQCKF